MKNRSILLFSLLFIIAVTPLSPLFSDDMIHFKDGRMVYGKIISVTDEKIEFIPEKEKRKKIIPREDVLEIKYSNGTTVQIQENWEAYPVIKLSDKGIGFGIIFEDKTEPSLLPLLLRTGLIMNKGKTDVKIYDKNKDKIAEGDASFDQYQLKFSYEPVQSAFYITPELGYFYRRVTVKDYSYSVDTVNEGIEGFIPGVVTDPETGKTYPKDSISSLAYSARFHSFYLDLKGGYNFVFGFSSFQFILNPYLYLSLVELRKSVFEFDLMDKKEKFSRPYSFSYLNTYGFGCEIGMFMPGLRSGIKFGYDLRYLPKFEISDKVKFNEVVYDYELGIYTTRENSARYTSILAHLFTIEFFFFL